jgi:cytoskeletal protein RodZ
MEELGNELRDAREKLGLTLEEVERETRIRTHHLEALERGDLEALPSSVQARGFLRNYADFLGLDLERVMTAYAGTLQTRRVRQKTAAREDASETGRQRGLQVPVRRPSWFSTDLIVAATVSLLVMVMMIWGGGLVMDALQEREQTQDRSAGELVVSATASSTATVEVTAAAAVGQPLSTAQATPTSTQPALLGLAEEIQLRVVAEMRAWVLVSVDGEQAYRGRVRPGEEQTFTAEGRLEITTGNGAALHVFANGQDQGLLGDVYQIVTRVWTLEGAQTPTPTPSLTPTITPPVTETPTPTATTLGEEG